MTETKPGDFRQLIRGIRELNRLIAIERAARKWQEAWKAYHHARSLPRDASLVRELRACRDALDDAEEGLFDALEAPPVAMRMAP